MYIDTQTLLYLIAFTLFDGFKFAMTVIILSTLMKGKKNDEESK